MRAAVSLSRRTLRAVAAAAAVLLVGCAAVGPDHRRPELALPEAWRVAPSEARDVVNTAWWEAFGDPALTRLVGEAIDANKDLIIAAHRIEQLAARLDVSLAEGMPQVGYQARRERVRRSEEQPALLALGREPTYNNTVVGLTASWEIDLWGRVARANEAARAQLLAGEESRRTVMLKVVTAVADTYVRLLSLDRQLELGRQSVANAQALAELAEARYRGGSGTQIEVVQARALVEESAAALPPIERDIATAENAIAGLLGRNPGPVPRGTITGLRLPVTPAGVPSDVLARRPDVLAAEQTLVAANARIGVAKSQYFPTISLTGALGLASDQLRWLMSRTARTGELAAGLTGVLFDGGRIAGDVRVAEAQQREMAQTYLQAVQTALREVDDALVARVRMADQVAAQDRRTRALEEVVAMTRQRFEGGRSTRTDILKAERELTLARDDQAQSVRDQFAAVVSIYKAMGGGWMVEQDRIRSTVPAAQAREPETRQ